MKKIHRSKYIETLTKQFGWTNRFASEFLVEYRTCRNFYNAYEQTMQSVYVDSNQKPNANPFRKGL